MSLSFGKKTTVKIMDTCVGFFDSDGAYPRLNLMPLCPRLTMLEKPEESTLSQASHVSSSPVKRACSPCNQKIYNSYRSLITYREDLHQNRRPY